ncbi:hypothetical protein KIN20_013443 [Parelaphostrongylus tenuis]|uniref:Uncharacterized protein n=1 Tax=Parelaphostrongylus tenuis TaxID=148309 RepID=A0AAD5MC51_PARTN|nr:hypothetical protein KIN20_013443 [Parelaphostrongylus tenuis]
MAGMDIYTPIRINDRAEEAARLERERIRQGQEHEYKIPLAVDRARMPVKERETKEQREEEEGKLREAEELEIRHVLRKAQMQK